MISIAFNGRLALALLTALLIADTRSAVAAQATQATSDVVLTIGGDVTQTLALTRADLKALPRTTVTVKEETREVKYEGVLVGTLLQKAGVPLGKELSGKAVASYVLASAKDGYQVVFALAEMDPAFTASEIMVADSVEGKPLFEYQGPIRIVAPHDKRGARSVRMLQRLDVVRLLK